MTHTEFRLPAEWERQSATLLAWPHAKTDWHERLGAIRDEYAALIETILPDQQVVVLVAPGERDFTQRFGSRAGLHSIEARFNDTWCRDYGPITLVGSGQRLALDFNFSGWGGKYEAALDNRVNTLLARERLFERLAFRQYLFELEGGAIDCDGQGTLLVNWHCLQARHRHLKRGEISHELHNLLNIDRIVGIDLEPMPGDDTDGHIDTLARFITPETIVFQTQPDNKRTNLLRSQLETLRREDGQAYELIALPAPDDLGRGIPASYVNFVFTNSACLVPAYGSHADESAREIIADARSDRQTRSVDASVMITQFGGPHCASMQIPAALG